MSPRDVARALAAVRVAIGASLLLAPRLTARVWIGPDAGRPGTSVIARAHGIREAVVGAIGLHTIDNPQVGPRWQRTLSLCDAVDLAATLAARRSLPRTGVALAVALASVGITGQLWAAGRLGAGSDGADL